jgi:hypothetical protein
MTESASLIAKLIGEYKANPLLPLELPLINKRLGSKAVSMDDFKEIYFRDPLFCSYLVDLAWYKTETKPSHPFAADHALSTIGLDGAKDYLKGLSIDVRQAHKRQQAGLSKELRFLMTSSLLAAELAQNLSGNTPKSKRLSWASMAHQFPDLLLWHIKPRPMWRIQYRQSKLAKKLPLFEQAKLGFELNQWRQAVSKEWHMSELNQITYTKPVPYRRKHLINYMQHGYSKNLNSLNAWHRTDSWLVLVSNWLARTLLSPWLANSYRHYYYIAMHAFGLSENRLSHGIWDAIDTTSKRLKGSALFVPACAHLYLPSPKIYPNWLNAAPKRPMKRNQKFAKSARELKQSANRIAIERLIRKMKTKPESIRNTNVLYREILDCCINHLDYSRANLLVVDWDNKLATTALFVQQENQPKIKLEFNFADKTPLRKFLVEQGFISFNTTKHAKIWPALPKEIIQQKVEQFVFFSFKPKDKVTTLVYLDYRGKHPINTESIKLTKQLLTTANQMLSKRIK